MKRIVISLVLLVLTLGLHAQDGYSWADFLRMATTDEESLGDEAWMDYLEELKTLHENPININTATREDLLRLPFLDERQVEEIQAYIYLHGQMQTLGELRLMELLDDETRKVLGLFVYAKEDKGDAKSPLLGYLKQRLDSRMDIPLYYRKGYMDGSYAGDALYHRIRYTIGNSKHFKAGVRVEKDAGERYYDSYGAYAQLSHIGCLSHVTVGDYRAGFGQGLVMGGGSMFGKSSLISRNQQGIRPMTSMDESSYLRGAALALRLGKEVEATALVSHRRLDATLNADGEVRTLLSTGYHRTRSERDSKGDVSSTLVGGHLQWTHGTVALGSTGYYQQFDKTLNPGSQAYRRYYPRGNSFGVMGVNYGYLGYRLKLQGETAYSTEQQGIATLNTATWSINRSYTLSMVQRFYGKQYYSFQARALSENSNVQDETGVLVRLQAQPWEGWQCVSYADFFYHPWPRYGMTHSSAGQEVMTQWSYKPNAANLFTGQYQMKRKEKQDVMEVHHRLKLQWTYQPGEQWKWQTMGTMHHVLESLGYAVGETAQWNSPGEQWKMSAMLSYFHTQDYDSRVYQYEPSLYQTMSSGSYYGHGMHGVVAGRWKAGNDRWMVEARMSSTCHFDKKEQSSGAQTIFSRWKNDIQIQIALNI